MLFKFTTKWSPILKLWERFNLKVIEPKDIIYTSKKCFC